MKTSNYQCIPSENEMPVFSFIWVMPGIFQACSLKYFRDIHQIKERKKKERRQAIISNCLSCEGNASNPRTFKAVKPSTFLVCFKINSGSQVSEMSSFGDCKVCVTVKGRPAGSCIRNRLSWSLSYRFTPDVSSPMLWATVLCEF